MMEAVERWFDILGTLIRFEGVPPYRSGRICSCTRLGGGTSIHLVSPVHYQETQRHYFCREQTLSAAHTQVRYPCPQIRPRGI
jgi:hypothetical protein